MDDQIHDREPPRVPLANLPTRGHWLRFGEGVQVARIWVKRDDHTGAEVMGNKIRKLEYLMAEAQAQDATHVITCGGEQSNHARATAFAAARLGLSKHPDPAHRRPGAPARLPPATSCSIGWSASELVWISRAAWRERTRLLARRGGGPRARRRRADRT